eukprot:CAMPEP_0167743780 /NCGR_PEP_ID=MMETSP0110_2-20121227/2206_1 /TAXON_ID=629695 /ORGANISM="Gymnochlora sp., Strain CCMP2014" /LENGTH=332 /DNA_ID=CAMNT_0007628189 /DNA_START=254 /DNA_END=1249 /DNA_ORIENTATION=+
MALTQSEKSPRSFMENRSQVDLKKDKEMGKVPSLAKLKGSGGSDSLSSASSRLSSRRKHRPSKKSLKIDEERSTVAPILTIMKEDLKGSDTPTPEVKSRFTTPHGVTPVSRIDSNMKVPLSPEQDAFTTSRIDFKRAKSDTSNPLKKLTAKYVSYHSADSSIEDKSQKTASKPIIRRHISESSANRRRRRVGLQGQVKQAMRLLSQSVSKCTALLRRRPRHLPANFEMFKANSRLMDLQKKPFAAEQVLLNGISFFSNDSAIKQRKDLENRIYFKASICGPHSIQVLNRMKQRRTEHAAYTRKAWQKVDDVMIQAMSDFLPTSDHVLTREKK